MDRKLTLELPTPGYDTTVALRSELSNMGFQASTVCTAYDTYHVRVEVRDSTANQGDIWQELQAAALAAAQFMAARETYPAIFELEPIGVNGQLEANGRVYVFCSDACRTAFDLKGIASKAAPQPLIDMCDGHECDSCGVVLGSAVTR